MTETPARASAVIIGAGIVGNSLGYHLARLGWRDLVQIDKGPLPNPGGSTGHASNFIFPIEYSKMMFELTEDSTARARPGSALTTARRHSSRVRRASRRAGWFAAFARPSGRLLPDRGRLLLLRRVLHGVAIRNTVPPILARPDAVKVPRTAPPAVPVLARGPPVPNSSSQGAPVPIAHWRSRRHHRGWWGRRGC